MPFMANFSFETKLAAWYVCVPLMRLLHVNSFQLFSERLAR